MYPESSTSMKTVSVLWRPSGGTALYALTALVFAAAAWAYFTPIDISVRAPGIVRPQGDPIRIVCEVGGRIRDVHVREGSEVLQGDPLIQLDPRDLILRQRSLETRIHFTELRIHDLQRQVDDTTAIEGQSTTLDAVDRDGARRNAQAALENARLRYARTDLLLREGLIAWRAIRPSRSSRSVRAYRSRAFSRAAWAFRRAPSRSTASRVVDCPSIAVVSSTCRCRSWMRSSVKWMRVSRDRCLRIRSRGSSWIRGSPWCTSEPSRTWTSRIRPPTSQTIRIGSPCGRTIPGARTEISIGVKYAQAAAANTRAVKA